MLRPVPISEEQCKGSRTVTGLVERLSVELADKRLTRQENLVDLEERSWLPRHCRGDRAAFPALIQAYRRPVYGYLTRCGLPAADRDDVFQSVFLKVHASARSYDPSRPLAPWIFTIVANSMRNHLSAAATRVMGASDPDLDRLHDPNPDPERIVQARDMVRRVENAIQTLSQAQREVVLLVAVVGFSQQTVAETLDLPLNTVKTHLRRARLALTKVVAGEAGARGREGDLDVDL